MSDLTQSQWRDIEKASVYLPQEHGLGRYIGLGVLKNILRKSKRTLDQNALLWVLYADALKQGGEALGGWTSADLHEYMLGEYFGWTEHKALGRTRLKPNRRSSRLTKTEFSDFLAFVVQRFAEHEIVLELPQERAA